MVSKLRGVGSHVLLARRKLIQGTPQLMALAVSPPPFLLFCAGPAGRVHQAEEEGIRSGTAEPVAERPVSAETPTDNRLSPSGAHHPHYPLPLTSQLSPFSVPPLLSLL